jgi:hypothetical protein
MYIVYEINDICVYVYYVPHTYNLLPVTAYSYFWKNTSLLHTVLEVLKIHATRKNCFHQVQSFNKDLYSYSSRQPNT